MRYLFHLKILRFSFLVAHRLLFTFFFGSWRCPNYKAGNYVVCTSCPAQSGEVAIGDVRFREWQICINGAVNILFFCFFKGPNSPPFLLAEVDSMTHLYKIEKNWYYKVTFGLVRTYKTERKCHYLFGKSRTPGKSLKFYIYDIINYR